MCKIFADDTSLFAEVLDLDKSVTELNIDLQKISPWANPDPKKQANEVIFTRHTTYCILLLNLTTIISLDVLIKNIWELSNLNFNTHIDKKNLKSSIK